jgi:large subunit ribosomal protein L4
VLLVSEDATEALYLAARNIPYVHVLDVMALNPVSLVGSDHVVVTVDAVKKIEEWLA